MAFDIKTLREELSLSQIEAVTYNEGPSVIVAGAGSGKTRVLTYKIAYLISQGLPASSIMALTFTNKAAREIKQRLQQLVGDKLSKYLWTGTFHSVFLRILKQESDLIGFSKEFVIYDTQDSKSLVKSIIKEMKLDETIYQPSSIFNRISSLKNRLILPQNYKRNGEWLTTDLHSGKQHFADIYEQYCNRCRDNNAMDFDDLLIHTFFLLKNNPDVLEKYQKRFAFFLIDEYQDTNIAQHRIVSLLAGLHKRIAAVGDDAQSIYSFRGANIDNILNFKQDFPETRIFKLEENYRSTQNIVGAANSLIEKNRHQIPKKVFSNLAIGDKIKVWSCFTDRTEADQVVTEIEQAIKRQENPEGIAILYRNNAQSRVFEDALRNNGIPYRILSGSSFYSRKEIKDILAYMRLVINHLDEESLKRIINYPTRGIGEKTQAMLLQYAHEKHINALNIIFDIDHHSISINSGAKGKLKRFGELITSLSIFYKENNAYDTAEKIVNESGILQEFSSNSDPDNASRRENIRELMSAIYEYCQRKIASGDDNPSLADFLSEVSLLTDQEDSEEDKKNAVTLLTIHSAKGLEYDTVFIVGLEEEILPSSMCKTEYEIEEERRLLYVAMTRAKRHCFLSYTKTRFRWGSILYPQPSRFLEDIDLKFLEMPEMFTQYEDTVFNPKASQSPFPSLSGQPSFRKKSSHKDSFSSTTSSNTLYEPTSKFKPIPKDTCTSPINCDFSIGDTVNHSVFGEGKVLEILSDQGNHKAKVDFKTVGTKTLLLKYAKLQKI